jgi:uncharacterized protein YjiS (DUF1127 family)
VRTTNHISRTIIGQIKNIRFTYQLTFARVSLSDKSGGLIGSFGVEPGAGLCRPDRTADHWKKAMTTLTTPAVPLWFAQAIVAAAVRLARRLVGAWRHRHDAAVLAALDDHMLADIGLSRTDLNDALSEPLWRDPTAVLARRHGERRRSRRGVQAGHGAAIDLIRKHAAPSIVPGADVFSFPPADPPARLTL